LPLGRSGLVPITPSCRLASAWPRSVARCPCFARSRDMMNAAYQYLDLTPLGRHEQGWVRRRDQYEPQGRRRMLPEVRVA